VVAVFVELSLEEFVGDEAGMRESVHAEDDYDVNTVVGFHEIAELVFIDDFLWYVGDFHSDIFGVLERSIEVEVGDVHGHEACGGGGNYTVE
jgi:hypothetical protein